jgi:4-azaleucine resistance transporter AzlC
MLRVSEAATAPAGERLDAAAARRRLILDALAITVSSGAFGVVYGLAARETGLSLAESIAMSVFVLAGASQFAALGLIAAGVPWLGIVLLTGFLNARHLLYSAAMAPWLRGSSTLQRAAMAHVVTDETFALAMAHFRRLGRADVAGYWIAAAFVCLSWILATAVGYMGGEAIPDPRQLGLDVVFPAAMAGLAVALTTGRPELLAAVIGAILAVTVALAWDPAVAVIAGGLLGPAVALAVGARASGTRTKTEPDAPDPHGGDGLP